jgi:primosomal protein N'
MDADEEKAAASAKRCADWLRKKLGGGIPVLGPAPSVLRREDGRSRYQVLIKAPPGSRKDISAAIAELRRKFGSARDVAELLTVDIDPYSFM